MIEDRDPSLLFALPEMSQGKSSPRDDSPNRNEEPWLQPIWRDLGGEYHFARFELVHRYFCTHKIHEVIFAYVGQHEVGGFPGYDRDSGYKIGEDLERFLRDGWPQATAAGQMVAHHASTQRMIYTVTIYCDDPFLCDKCGRFHPHNRFVPHLPWIRRDDSIDHAVIHNLIGQRGRTPEFQIKECGRKFCRESRAQTLDRMKRTDEARARTAAYNAELRQPRPTSEFPPRRSPRKAYVYAIQTGKYVKIGVAGDVTKRVNDLQTSCPTKLSIINAWRHHDAERLERALHKKFKRHRVSGEWFRLPPGAVEMLRHANRLDEIATTMN